MDARVKPAHDNRSFLRAFVPLWFKAA